MAAVTLMACTDPPAESAAPSILLVSIDSLRADRLGAYGNPRDTSPTIDRLARTGVRFARALSPTSWTLPAHATLLTGLRQRNHGVINTGDRIAEDLESLPELFRRAGYETVGLYSGPFLDPAYGFDQGFDRYLSCMSDETEALEGAPAWNSSHRDRTNPAIQAAFRGWLEERPDDRRPFFAFVHMWDVHYDYIAPEPYDSMFATDYDGKLDGRRIFGSGFPLDASQRDVAHLLSLYDAEIRYTDDTLARIIDSLRTRGLLDQTLIVVTSDHGEEFKDHGGKGHQHTLYEELIRVPLILWAKRGLPRGMVVEEPVMLSDVAPTLAELAGLTPPAGMDGSSLLPLIRGEETAPRTVFSALYSPGAPELKIASARRGSTKVLYNLHSGQWEHYDLDRDPGEQKQSGADFPELRRQAMEYVSAAQLALQRTGKEERRDLPAGLPDEVEEQLRQLGYIETP